MGVGESAAGTAVVASSTGPCEATALGSAGAGGTSAVTGSITSVTLLGTIVEVTGGKSEALSVAGTLAVLGYPTVLL
jgi:hypothetical protein